MNHDVALVRAPGLPPVGLAVLVTAPGTPTEREAGIARLTEAAWSEVLATDAGRDAADDPTMSP